MLEAAFLSVMAGSDDRRLAAACAEGNATVFEEIYNRFGPRMKRIAYNHLGTIADAEDAVQDAFLKIHRGARTYSGEASFSTWVFKVLINTCYDTLRKRKRRPAETAIDVIADTRSAPSTDDLKRMTLRRLLERLPEQRRTVFTLFEIEGMSHAEIAQILDISEGNSKWILFATKKELQQQWKTTR